MKFFLIFAFLLLLIIPKTSFAHSDEPQIRGDYTVEITQTPLSPLTGEDVDIVFTFENESGEPIKELQGNFLIKKNEKQGFVGEKPKEKIEIIHTEKGYTDGAGSTGLRYKFKNEGFYDVEYVWGVQEDEGAGKQIQVREPTSYFLLQELIKRLWLFVGIAFVGIMIGGFMMFLFLTTTLHPKK